MRIPFLPPILFILVGLPGCIQITKKPLIYHMNTFTPALKTSIDVQTPIVTAPPITIWIHGTRLLPSNMFKNFFYSKPGLHHYSALGHQYHQRKIAQTLIASNPLLFADEYFYLFGWNGKLSSQEREKAARMLYEELKILCHTYQQIYNAKPVIRILSHSHGGNVALLLNKVKDTDDVTLFIDELILLATPVQMQTMHYAHADVFGKIYSLYSILDILQVIDPQGFTQKTKDIKPPLFSARLFPHHEKIDQFAIKINDRSIMHIEFVNLKFLQQLTHIITQINSWQKESNLSLPDWSTRDKCVCLNTKTKSLHRK